MTAATATTTTTRSADEATYYLAAVRAALSDLPAEERDDLLEDLEAHLAEVAAEGEALVVRLGTPAEFAAELRASAGYPGGEGRRAVRDRLAERLERARAHPRYEPAMGFLRDVRPGWWVVRGWLAVFAVDRLFGSQRSADVLPSLYGEKLLGVLVTVAAVVASVRLGRAGLTSARLGALSLAASVVVGLLGLATPLGDDGPEVVYDEVGYGDGYGDGYGYGRAPDGRPVSNLFPFAADGSPLEGVLIYDQDGQPVEDPTGDPSVLPRHAYPRPGATRPSVLLPSSATTTTTTTTTAPTTTTTLPPPS